MERYSIQVMHLLRLLMVATLVAAHFDVNLEYSLDDWSTSAPLGRVELSSLEENYTGVFHLAPEAKNSLGSSLFNNKDSYFRVKALSSRHPNKPLYTFNQPCVLLRSRLSLEIFMSVSARRQAVLSLTVFPNPRPSSDDRSCPSLPQGILPQGVVVVTNEVGIPAPDTQSYLEKMEREKRARQHSSENDNRGFIQKYWMYIVPVVLFLFLSSFSSQEGQAE